MIDAKDIGSRIRTLRLDKDMSQGDLRIFIDLINILGCSADELLCIEIKKSRPVFLRWLDDLLADCNSQELKIISETVRTLKVSLREFGFSYRWDR